MSSPSTILQKVVPAQLGFFAIYNPSLGNTDETLDDQIVYYSCPETRKRNRQYRRSGKSPAKSTQEEKNERLRQIGLAQGMVEFAGTFSKGKAVDTIETEQSRIILHELEAGWWLLAVSSIHLRYNSRDANPLFSQ
jgi:First Longin domain of INTU, CCZ1 and HPS4